MILVIIIPLIPFILFAIIWIIYVFRKNRQIKESLNSKYGIPLKQFWISRAWHNLAIRNTPTIVSFYEDFLVITYLYSGIEYVVPKNTNNIKLFRGLFLTFVIEIPIETKTIELCGYRVKHEKAFLNFFQNITLQKSPIPIP